MQRFGKEQKCAGHNYLQYQLSWFGKKYDEENDIAFAGESKACKKLNEFLESYVGKELYKNSNEQKESSKDSKEDEQKELIKDAKEDEQEKFREEFTRLSDEAFDRQDENKERQYGIDKIKKILKEYNPNYELQSVRSTTGDKKTYWTVVRLDSDLEEAGMNADQEDDKAPVPPRSPV